MIRNFHNLPTSGTALWGRRDELAVSLEELDMLQSIPQLVQEIRSSLRCITAEQAMKEIANGNGVLIDVRESAEVEAQPAPLSTPIPRGVLEMKVSKQFPDANHPIYLHCASGARATLSAEQLRRIGYKRVSVITCGIADVCKSQRG